MDSPALAFAGTAAGTRALTEADFTGLVREHQAMVFSIALRYLNDRGQAEEVAQDVFLQLFRNLPGLASPEHVRNWLRKVAAHRAIDCGRRRMVAPEVELDQVREPSVEDTPEDPMLRESLRKLVASLPERSRMLVILRYQEELEPGEIAAVLGIPERTVRTQLWRTVAHLREKAARLLAPRVGEVGR
jgi:RNA polymerase sigma-70 factor (ECF subfamily)